MKLHLPKGLFVAVMAACGLAQTAYGDDWVRDTNNTDSYYIITESSTLLVDAYDITNPTPNYQIKAGSDGQKTINQLILVSGKQSFFMWNWQPEPNGRNLNLQVKELQFGQDGTGAGSISVNANQVVTINKVAATSSITSLTNAGTLTIGTSAEGEAPASTTTLSGTITNSGSLTLNGDIVVTADARLNLAEVKYADNKYSKDGGATYTTNGYAVYDEAYEVIAKGAGATVEANTITFRGQADTKLVHVQNANEDYWAVFNKNGVDWNIYGVMESEELASSTASTYILADTATLTFSDSMPHGDSSTRVTKLNVVGAGTVAINTLGSDNHNSAVDLGEDFTGTLRITGGNMQLSSFKLHDDVKLELVSGQSWSDVTIDREVLLNAENIDSSYDFAYSDVTINGKVTGNYLQMTSQNNGGGTLTLNHAENKIDAIKLVARTLNLNGGKVGTVYAGGGTTNINEGATVTTVNQSAGTVNIASGASVSTIAQTGGTTNINGAEINHSGVLSASGGRINMTSGSVTLSDKTQVHTISSTVDMAGTSGTYTGNLNLGAGVKVTATDAANFWLGGEAAVNLAKDAEFTRGDITVVGTGSSSAITRSVTDQNNNDYSSTSSTHKISNAVVKNTTAGTQDTPKAVTYANIMDNVGVVNEGANSTLTLTNTANKLNSVDAAKGDITLQNTSAQELSTLAIAAGKTVAVYTGTDTANVGTLTVSGTTFGAEATLNSNLVLGTGATVTLEGALTMGGSLTLSKGLTLGGDLYTAIKSMTEDTEAIVLFTGVTELLGVDALTRSGEINFSTYFTNVTSETGTYELYYNGGQVSVAFAATPVVDPDGGETDIPEPSTGALSLLGLAALAMRRRRK